MVCGRSAFKSVYNNIESFRSTYIPTRDEQDCLFKAFKKNIINGKNVSAMEIKDALMKHKALRGRSMSIIRLNVYNIIKGKTKWILHLLN